MPSKADVDTNQLKLEHCSAPRSLTDAGYGSALPSWTAPVAFMILKMGIVPADRLSSSPSDCADYGDTRAMGSIRIDHRLEARGCGRRQFQVWRWWRIQLSRCKFAVGYRASVTHPANVGSSQYAGQKRELCR